MINVYVKFLKNYLVILIIIGKKILYEKFVGVCLIYIVEVMMKDGKVL